MTTHHATWPRLSSLGLLSKVGLVFLVLTLLGGYIVSGIFLKQHYENRDERPGLTMTDIVGAYHGVTSPSPLLSALNRGHPEELAPAKRQALVSWLESGRIGEDYDNLDLGEYVPEEIIFESCISCHTRGSTEAGGEAAKWPLQYPDDVLAIAVSRQVMPTDPIKILTSMHAHAPSLAMVLIMMTLLSAMSRWPGKLTGLIAAVGGIGLFLDLLGQWLARSDALWAYAIVGGGFASSMGVGLLGILVIGELILPAKKAP